MPQKDVPDPTRKGFPIAGGDSRELAPAGNSSGEMGARTTRGTLTTFAMQLPDHR